MVMSMRSTGGEREHNAYPRPRPATYDAGAGIDKKANLFDLLLAAMVDSVVETHGCAERNGTKEEYFARPLHRNAMLHVTLGVLLRDDAITRLQELSRRTSQFVLLTHRADH